VASPCLRWLASVWTLRVQPSFNSCGRRLSRCLDVALRRDRLVGMAHMERGAFSRAQCRPPAPDFTTRGQRSASKVFFGERRPTLARADVLALEGMIGSYAAAARKVGGAAANAFIPCRAWVAFATVLNAEIVRRNPQEADARSD